MEARRVWERAGPPSWERGLPVDTFMQALKNLGPMRLAVVGALVFGLVGFFVFLGSRFTTSDMALLYSNLSTQDSAKIVKQLESQNIPYELRGNGTTIMVPQGQVLRERLALANQGLPSGGAVGWELFDNVNSLGTTDFMQNVDLLRALEGELARTIESINLVHRARVHLVLPRRDLFSREKQKASASVVLQMRGPQRLDNSQVAAVRFLVASAVPQLTPDKVTVIDDRGTLLAGGFGDANSVAGETSKMQQRRRSIEHQYSQTIENLLEKTVGFGRVRAEVSADVDFDKVSTQQEIYNPDGQVVRSTQTIDQTSSDQNTQGQQAVSVASQLPTASSNSGSNSNSQSAQNRNEETVNYEISKKVVNHVQEPGTVKRLSVAVLVDEVRYDTNGKLLTDKNGNPITKPRSAKEMQQLKTLVESAIGYNAKRGDAVQVIQMPFAQLHTPEEKLQLFFGLDKNSLLKLAEFMVLGIVAILIILLVLRPLISRAFESLPSAQEAAERLLADHTAAAPALTGPSAPGVPVESDEDEEHFEELIDIDRVEGRVRASSVKKVGEIVQKHPEEALSILRSWMYQEG